MSSQPLTSPWNKFLDLDDRKVYDAAAEQAAGDKARSFVVEFNFQKARIAYDLDSNDFGILLEQKPPEGVVRWINIWSPSTQRPAVERIGKCYDFSPRLLAVMTTTTQSSPERFRPTETSDRSDVEAVSVSTETKSFTPTPTKKAGTRAPEIYRLVKETMNYTSFDRGDNFLCIGANWLHRRPEMATERNLTLVLSFQETPQSEHPDNDQWTKEELSNMRSNTVAVLLQLSRHGAEDKERDPVTLKSVRQALHKEKNECDVAREGSSNLFFYLFEDYSGVAPVLKASAELHSLSERILESTSRRSKVKTGDVIRPLHTMRKELRQLQHLFESYKSLIRHICWSRSVDAHPEGLCGVLESSVADSKDVKISPLARRRFERLRERLQLLMLNTIQEYLDELNALSDTYFNLTAQKDSQATARLSRSATLLAKLSVFFLPISFMTSYFSVEIPDLVEHYTPKMYWICFAVIAGLSFISLFFFSRMLEFLIDVFESWADSASRKFHRLCGFDGYDERDEY